MALVLSLADARTAKVKARLHAYAASHDPAMVETATELIDARRIFCCDSVAVLIDRYGDHTRVGYDEIVGVSPVLPMADILAFTGSHLSEVEPADGEAAKVLPFPARRN
jgi:hypothetical protein